MDPIAHLRAEHVVDEPVLGDPWQVPEGVGGNDRVEVVAVAGDGRVRAGNPRLDPRLELLGRGVH